MGDERIAAVEEVPADGTLLYTVREVDEGGSEREARGGGDDQQESVEDGASDEQEAILLRLSDGAVASFLNYCMHWTDVKLDTGDGAPVRGDEVVCRKHAATFEKDSGLCTHGPCEGARLDAVEVAVRDGDVYLADPDYEFVGKGVGDDDPADLSTSPGARLGF